MTKQHEFPSRPPFDLLDLDGDCRMGYAADDVQEPEVDDAAARLRIIKRKAALLMARSGLGDAFFPAGQQQWLPSVRVLTRWPMMCCLFFADCIKLVKIRERFKILYLSVRRKYRQILFKRRRRSERMYQMTSASFGVVKCLEGKNEGDRVSEWRINRCQSKSCPKIQIPQICVDLVDDATVLGEQSSLHPADLCNAIN